MLYREIWNVSVCACGGGCMIQNFGEYDKSRVTIVRDICATAKGYETMTARKIQRVQE